MSIFKIKNHIFIRLAVFRATTITNTSGTYGDTSAGTNTGAGSNAKKHGHRHRKVKIVVLVPVLALALKLALVRGTGY